MKRAILLPVALAGLVALAGCDDYLLEGGGGGSAQVDAVLALTGDAAAGSEHFTSADCAECHDPAGLGETEDGWLGPALAPVVPVLSDAEIVGVILDGRKMMPPADVDAQEAADLLAWLRATFPE